MPGFKAEIKIVLKKGVTDPEGSNTKRSLELLGFKGVSDVKSIKSFEITLVSRNDKIAKSQFEKMCKLLLANPVIHNYSIALKKC